MSSLIKNIFVLIEMITVVVLNSASKNYLNHVLKSKINVREYEKDFWFYYFKTINSSTISFQSEHSMASDENNWFFLQVLIDSTEKCNDSKTEWSELS